MLIRAPSEAFKSRTRWHSLACSDALVLLVDLDGALLECADSPREASLDLDAILMLNHLATSGIRIVIVSGRPSASIDDLRPLVPGAWWAAEHGSRLRDPEFTAHPAMTAPDLDGVAARFIVTWVRDKMPNAQIVAIGDAFADEEMFAELEDGDALVAVGRRATRADAWVADVGGARMFLRWIAETRRGRDVPLPISTATDSRSRVSAGH